MAEGIVSSEKNGDLRRLMVDELGQLTMLHIYPHRSPHDTDLSITSMVSAGMHINIAGWEWIHGKGTSQISALMSPP